MVEPGFSAVGLRDNSLLQQDGHCVETSTRPLYYSGPAAIRLLRASCGQQPHSKLYDVAPEQCLLMDDLRKLGFDSEVMLNHTGQFEGFIDECVPKAHCQRRKSVSPVCNVPGGFRWFVNLA